MMLCEKNKAWICGEMLKELKLNSPKFDGQCIEIVSVIERLTQNGIKGRDMRRKLITPL